MEVQQVIERVKVWCDQQGLLERGDQVLIACSGGPDSLALVDILLNLQSKWDLRLAVAHVEHGIRGAVSVADADFVERFCEERKLPCFRKDIAVPQYAKQYGLSMEDAARTVRYDFFAEITAKLGGAKIATGHHKDDQAETVLLHFLRGAGSGGMGGIRPMRCGIIRPLLSISRRDIEQYCQMCDLQPRFDETNHSTDYLRNKIRLELLPQLKAVYNPAITEALCRSGEVIGAENDFIHQCAVQSLAEIAELKKDGFTFCCTALKQLHLALQRELFRVAVEKLRGHLKGISFAHIDQMVEFSLKGKTGARLVLPDGLLLQCSYGTVTLSYRQVLPQGDLATDSGLPTVLSDEGTTEFSGLGIRVETVVLNREVKPQGENQIICDMDRLVMPLVVRYRQNGDRFWPSGAGGSKKLKDFLIDQKIERAARDALLLFCDQEGVFWVAGIRQNEISRVSGQTKKFLLITIVPDKINNEI